jgi:uncharacterized protein YaaR (DUF327 family)
MAELEAQKRDNIPDTTQEVWYRTFKNRGWDKIKFDTQFQKVLNNPSYGAVKIDEFFTEQQIYTDVQVGKMIESRINDMIRKGEKLLGDKEIKTLPEYYGITNEYIKIAVAKKLVFTNYTVKQELIEEIIDKVMEEIKNKQIQSPLG